jgi:hypothetical protein
MDATQARQAQPVDGQEATRHVELPVMVRAPRWVRARRFVASEIGRRGMFLLTMDAAVVGTALEVEIPRAGQPGIPARVTVHACYGTAAMAPGRRPPGWCVMFNDLGEGQWRELEALVDAREQRDSLPAARPGPSAAPVRSDPPDPHGSLSPSRLFADLLEERAAPDLGAAALDPLDFGRPGVARPRA